MKTLFGMTAVVAVAAMSLAAIDGADARGVRGGGNISTNSIQVGPRATSPVINPNRVGPQQFPQRQIRGPRESGRGFNCYQVANHNGFRMPLTDVHFPMTGGGVRTRCPQRI